MPYIQFAVVALAAFLFSAVVPELRYHLNIPRIVGDTAVIGSMGAFAVATAGIIVFLTRNVIDALRIRKIPATIRGEKGRFRKAS